MKVAVKSGNDYIIAKFISNWVELCACCHTDVEGCAVLKSETTESARIKWLFWLLHRYFWPKFRTQLEGRECSSHLQQLHIPLRFHNPARPPRGQLTHPNLIKRRRTSSRWRKTIKGRDRQPGNRPKRGARITAAAAWHRISALNLTCFLSRLMLTRSKEKRWSSAPTSSLPRSSSSRKVS